MDWMLFLITFCLVFVGAVFFGFPIGLVVGKRRTRREYEEKYVFETNDVLDAEFIECRRFRK